MRGSLPSQRETPRSRDPHWFTGLEQNTQRFVLVRQGVALHWRNGLCGVLLCMQVCTVQVACLLMHECTYANEKDEAWLPGCRAAVVADVHRSESLHLQRKRL